MPLYLYECENPACPSGGSFSEIQSIRDDALAVCPHCGGKVSRVVCPVGMSTPAGDSKLKDMSDVCIKAPQTETYMIQELHLPVYHMLCIAAENEFFGD